MNERFYCEVIKATVTQPICDDRIERQAIDCAGCEKFQNTAPAIMPETKQTASQMLCSIEGCEDRVDAKGLCSKHYHRQMYLLGKDKQSTGGEQMSATGIKVCVGYNKADGTTVTCGKEYKPNSNVQKRCPECREAMGIEINKPRYGSKKPEARSQKPEARSQKPEARSQKPEARSQKPEARSQKLPPVKSSLKNSESAMQNLIAKREDLHDEIARIDGAIEVLKKYGA